MSLLSIVVKRDGPRGWHRIDKDKYDADPSAYVVCDETGKPLSDPLDHDGDGRKDGSRKPSEDDDLKPLRADYVAKFGKKPFGGWGAEALRAKIAEKLG